MAFGNRSGKIFVYKNKWTQRWALSTTLWTFMRVCLPIALIKYLPSCSDMLTCFARKLRLDPWAISPACSLSQLWSGSSVADRCAPFLDRWGFIQLLFFFSWISIQNVAVKSWLKLLCSRSLSLMKELVKSICPCRELIAVWIRLGVNFYIFHFPLVLWRELFSY